MISSMSVYASGDMYSILWNVEKILWPTYTINACSPLQHLVYPCTLMKIFICQSALIRIYLQATAVV
jgi:hypothetical protein